MNSCLNNKYKYEATWEVAFYLCMTIVSLFFSVARWGQQEICSCSLLTWCCDSLLQEPPFSAPILPLQCHWAEFPSHDISPGWLCLLFCGETLPREPRWIMHRYRDMCICSMTGIYGLRTSVECSMDQLGIGSGMLVFLEEFGIPWDLFWKIGA